MASERAMVTVLETIGTQIEGFIAASVVDVDSGFSLAVTTQLPEFDIVTASAHSSELVKCQERTMRALDHSSTLQELLITMDDRINLIRILSPEIFFYLTAERAVTNQAIVRAVVNRYADRLTID